MAHIPMKGLTNFIADIRACKSKEAETRRVDKEMAHIRQKFTSKSGLDAYGRKKYTWKLMYIYMMGYEVDVGHMEALRMISSSDASYTEKFAGYMTYSILLNENNELLRLIIQSVKKDLDSRNEVYQCLALNLIANVGGQEFAESLAADVQKLLVAATSRVWVKKKAALALLRMYRKYPEVIPQDGFATRILPLLDDHSLGVVVSASALFLGLASHSTEGMDMVVDKTINLLSSLRFHRERYGDYKYYHTINPWLQVRLLRLLQYFGPPEDQTVGGRLHDVLKNILTKTDVTKSVNKNNADHGILFEAINLIIHHCRHGRMDQHEQAAAMLGKFISVKEPNIRYLGLETMARLTRIPQCLPEIRRHEETIKNSLSESDISIRKRALDVMYAMCDRTNGKQIVDAMVTYLDSSDVLLKEELVLKIAILAEKHAPNLKWYIDTVLQLIAKAGDYVSDDIWFRVVQIVTNHEELQDYAASKVYEALQSPGIHESGVKVGGYILGEFGHQIQNEAITSEALLESLRRHFGGAGRDTKALLLSAFIKMANTYPELKEPVAAIFERYRDNVDSEIQQRAVEYAVMNRDENDDLMNAVFEIMPNFSERESALEKRLKKANKNTTDRDVWSEAKGRGEGGDGDDDDDSDSDESDDDDDDDDDEEDEEDEDASKSSDDSDESDGDEAGGNEVDLLGFGGGGGGGGSWPQQDAAAVNAAVGKDSAVLYQHKNLQVGVKIMSGAGVQAKMILYVGNRTGQDMGDVRATLASGSAGVDLQVKPQSLAVANGAQQPIYLLWRCRAPFAQAPVVRLSFTHGGAACTVDMTAPLLANRFLTPAEAAKDGFVGLWKSHTAAAQEVVKAAEAVGPDSLRGEVAASLHAFNVADVEKDPVNVSLSATFSYGGESSPVLMRFETKPGNRFARVTVRSASEAISGAVMSSIKVLLGAASV